MCAASAVAGSNGEFIVRRMIRLDRWAWKATRSRTSLRLHPCNKCVINCPRGVDIIGIMRSIRTMTARWAAPDFTARRHRQLRFQRQPWGGEAREAHRLDEGPRCSGVTRGYRLPSLSAARPATTPQPQHRPLVVKLLAQAGVVRGHRRRGKLLRRKPAQDGDESGFMKLARQIGPLQRQGREEDSSSRRRTAITPTQGYPRSAGVGGYPP